MERRVGKYYLTERKRENGLSFSLAGKGHTKIRNGDGIRQFCSKERLETHAEVIVSGTKEDLERMMEAIEKAAKHYNRFPDRKMSFCVRLFPSHEGRNLPV